ncbi:MAG: aspartyl protease family protein [Oceanicaulis sp.]
MMVLAAVLALTLQTGPAALERTEDGRLSVDVKIEGRGPWPFIVDTGASHTAIAEPLAVEFGFTPGGDLSEVQTLTEQIRSERVTLEQVSAAGVTVGFLEAVVVAAPSDLELRIFGLLGADVFAGRIVRLDGANARLDTNAPRPAFEDARLHEQRNVPVARATLSRLSDSVPVMIDTGSARTIVNTALQRRLRAASPGLRYSVGSATRLAREEDAEAVRLRGLRAGGLCARNIVAVAADVDVFRALGWANRPAMIMGMDALHDAVLTIDHRTGAVEISPADGARCG